MHAFNRGRAGPRQSTPANVQCQKCLKRGHYSYECKTAPQERPYKARPSRTQQLLNPRLAPKLTNETHDDVTRKKGTADEELAKKEAERARKRELEDDDEPVVPGPDHKRQRSNSVDSVSTISTRSSRSPPPRRRASPSPHRARDVSPPARRSGRTRSTSPDSFSDRSRGRSLSQETSRRRRDTGNRSVTRSPSPPRRALRDDHPDRDSSPPRYSRGARDGTGPGRPQRRFDSRSPRPDSGGQDRPGSGGYERFRDRSRSQDRGGPYRGPESQSAPLQRQPGPPRERSLSPFSKRLALTQAMNMGR